MKLDDFQQGQKLSLDFTPMIDVVFLLVLFFAVSMSLVNPAKLDELKVGIEALTHEKGTLAEELERRNVELNARNDRIMLLDARLIELRKALEAVETTKRQQGEAIAAQEAKIKDANNLLGETERAAAARTPRPRRARGGRQHRALPW